MKYDETRFMRNLSARSGQLHAPAAFSLGNIGPSYAFNRVSTGPLAGVDVLEKHFFLPEPSIEPRFLGHPSRRLITISTMLIQLLSRPHRTLYCKQAVRLFNLMKPELFF